MIDTDTLLFEQLNEALARRQELSTVESMYEREVAKSGDFEQSMSEIFRREYELDQIADARTSHQTRMVDL